MRSLDGVVLTGTRAGGKSAVGRALASRDDRFVEVRRVTTRPRREDDEAEYEYVSAAEFGALRSQGELLVSVEYSGALYGIRSREVERVGGAGQIPVLIVAPQCLSDSETFGTRGSEEMVAPRFATFFLDATDEELDRRLISRSAVPRQGEREEDRKYRSLCHYILMAGAPSEQSDLIREVWDGFGRGGILVGRVIGLMLRCGTLLSQAEVSRVSGASYDLALGDEYYYGGKIHTLSASAPFLLIEPYDYAIVTSHEEACLPADVAGRFDLTVGLFCQGIILSNGPQVDPGFRGPLFCLFFNTSSSPVLLKRRQHYCTLEFHKLTEPARPYSGPYLGKRLLDYLPLNVAQGAINELKKELEKVREQNQNLQNITWAVLALLIALVSIWVALQ